MPFVSKAATSIRLLDQLQALGFNDEAFSALHHFSVKQGKKGDTIAAHRAYLVKQGAGNVRAANERVQERLQWVLKAYRADSSKTFLELSRAAATAIAFRPSDYEPGGGKYGEDSDD